MTEVKTEKRMKDRTIGISYRGPSLRKRLLSQAIHRGTKNLRPVHRQQKRQSYKDRSPKYRRQLGPGGSQNRWLDPGVRAHCTLQETSLDLVGSRRSQAAVM